MENIITGFEQLNLGQIGQPGFAQAKLEVLRNLRELPGVYRGGPNGAPAPHSLTQDIFQQEEDEIDALNNELLQIGRDLQACFSRFGKHGSLNCGPYYAWYDRARALLLQRAAASQNNLADPVQRRIALFVIQPALGLVASNVARQYDKDLGEKTFSKLVLNTAAKLIGSRLDFVQGALTMHQMHM